jgi:hypothetical protein
VGGGGDMPWSVGSLLGPSIKLEMGGRDILDPFVASMADEKAG